MELDGVAIPYTASVREYNRGRAGYIAEALEQPVLLPRDMEAYRRFSQPELFLSLKRDLAMVFVAEEYCYDNRKLAEAEAQSRAEVEKFVESFKQENFELTEKFKESKKARKSALAGLKNAETQAEDQRQKLFVTETSLATEKQTVLDLKATLQKAEEEVRRAKEEAQLIREAHRRFSQPELFLSLKRDLAMVFVAEEYCRDNRKLAEAEAQSRAEVEKSVGSLKQENFELMEKFKESEKARKSALAGLKNAETQAKDQRQKLFEEVRRAKEEAQLIREAAEAKKKTAYQLGVGETEARLSEEIPEVCRDYCSISWAHALDAAGIPADSALRMPGSVFFPPEIRENPDGAPEASEQAMTILDTIPLLDKAKNPAKESISEVPPPQPEQKENPPAEA
ncbi:uncharacterized protein LOC126719754 [Quercus robur]|uniref:uncharacterized protein LOC126719754 n=1 Tax=Quercus robur TaxID=38942 RepID=UPI00216328F4|nr:uncharacterized protein LOC126719754 [Quercus robur]